MIDRREILAAAGNLGLLPNVVEKDYVLSWILAGIFNHPALAESWVFKGGTCLKKCYFETYRFSEDLDFTLTDGNHLNVDFLRATFGDISAWVYDRSGIELPPGHLAFEVYQNRRDRPAGAGRISYRGPIAPSGGDLPRIKLDLTLDEILVLPAAVRPVAHPYSDAPEEGFHARCYAYEEAFAEKVRALGERARPRDLYDVINLYRNDSFKPAAAAIHDVLTQKCTFKGIALPTLSALEATRAEMEGDWANMLGHQLPSLPPVDAFWGELPAVFAWLLGGAEPAAPAAFPMAAGDTIVRAPAGGLVIPGLASTAPLEVIRFAASNRLCVELDYEDEQGRRSVRTIEPYSLRRTQADDVLLHAVRADSGANRTYRVDRIRGARATNRTFAPRHAIELTPSGPLSVPQSERTPRVSGGWGAPRQARSPARPTGPKYVYQCGMCGKRFERQTRNSTLRPHKSTSGWPCSGRHGMLVDTKW